MAQLYILTPLADGPFAGLGLVDRAVFGAIWDRYKVSCYTQVGTAGDCPYIDDDGNVYCFYKQADLARVVGVSDRTLRRSLAVLRERGLIVTCKTAYMGTCRYYVGRDARVWLQPQRAVSLIR